MLNSSAVVIGNWQIFHNGHLSLFEQALQQFNHLIVVLNSPFRSRDSRNPFNLQERIGLIKSSLPGKYRDRVSFVSVRNYAHDDAWVRNLINVVELSVEQNTVFTLFHCTNDSNSTWKLVRNWHSALVPSDYPYLNSTYLRDALFSSNVVDEGLSRIANSIPTSVAEYIRNWATFSEFTNAVREHTAITNYKKTWYAPSYFTADSLVVANNHVLLVQRGGSIGYGQWALPGGFVDSGEPIFDAALRELREETSLDCSVAFANDHLISSKVFDYPFRSPRGRIITTAFFFDLGDNISLPVVRGQDDAMTAKWIPICDLLSYESCLFEDHAAILDAFLCIF